jgi:hypothetical protein
LAIVLAAGEAEVLLSGMGFTEVPVRNLVHKGRL